MEIRKIEMTTITKIAMFTDIHWGARANSVDHNRDNLDYIDWFIGQLTGKDISHIAFLGDWFENRNSINVMTMKYSYDGMKKLNSLGIPILFMIGNHDLFHRHSRNVHPLGVFQEFENVVLIDEPTSINEKFLFSPYLFHDEYPNLAGTINSHNVVFGHFEFRNFMVTGYNSVLEHGPDHNALTGPKHIFSGHYHKRQAADNVVYIGNVFPTNYGDAGDSERGMCFYDVEKDFVAFVDWPDLPTFLKVKLSDVLAGNWEPKKKMRVRCVVDMDITYTEAQAVRETMTEMYELREFTLEEMLDEKSDAIAGDDVIDATNDFKSIDELVIKQLETLSGVTNIKPDKLIAIYKDLVTHQE